MKSLMEKEKYTHLPCSTSFMSWVTQKRDKYRGLRNGRHSQHPGLWEKGTKDVRKQ